MRNGELTIPTVRREDAGTYVCSAANDYGITEHPVQLVVGGASGELDKIFVIIASITLNFHPYVFLSYFCANSHHAKFFTNDFVI